MAQRQYKRNQDDDYTRNALKDGFTCFAVSPISAPSTTFMSKEKAEDYDEMAEMMAEFGDRPIRRRLSDDYEDWEL